MKKLLLLTALSIVAVTLFAQTPKRSRSERRSRNYKGCVTYTDSLVRRISWQAIDSMRAHNYIKD